MKTFIDSLDRPRLMLIISVLMFFIGVALLAPGMAFFDSHTARIFPLVLSAAAFYCALYFLVSAMTLLKLDREESAAE